MAAMKRFSDLHARNLHWLNTASIVLLPKKEGAEEITDFRPISLIHGFAKIAAKVLSRRLAPRMNDIVSQAQSAFIKSRSMLVGFTDGRRLLSSSSSTLGKLLIMSDGTTFLSYYNALAFPLDSGIGSWLFLVPPHEGYSSTASPGIPSSTVVGYGKETHFLLYSSILP
jgi:hypothetical protein